MEEGLYCRYHQFKGHSIEDCHTFKSLVHQFLDEGESLTPEDIIISDEYLNGIWDSDDEDVYLDDIVQNDSPLDVILTRSGRVQTQDPPQLSSTNLPIIPPLTEDNEIVKQLKHTKVEMNVWKLLASSYDHRMAVMDALTKIGEDAETTPQGLVNFLTKEGI